MDGEKTYSKLAILTTITATLTSTVTAQLSGNSQIPGTEFAISDIINLLLFWDLGSGAGFWTGLVFFIATWLGFYFATRPLLLELYGVIIENFPTSDGRRSWSTNSDDEPLGMKGLALTTSFVTTQVVGQFFGLIPMILLGGIGLLVFLWSMYYGQDAFRENFSNTVRSSEGGEGSTEELEEELEEAKEELRDELQRDEGIKEKISRMRAEGKDFDSAVNELEQTNLPDGVKRELEQIKNEWHDEQQKEYSLAEVLDEVAKEQKSEIEEEVEILELEEYIERELSHLVNIDQDMDQRIEELKAELREMKEREQREGVTPELRQEFESFQENLNQLKDELNQAREEIEDVKEKESEKEKEEEDLDNRTSQTESEVGEAESEADEINKEASDEEQREDEIEEEVSEYGEALKQDRERYKEDMREIHNDVDMEESTAEKESIEAREAHDEMMKVDDIEQAERELTEEDRAKVDQLEEDLMNYFDEVDQLEEEANAIKGFAERAEMEEEEFEENLQDLVERFEWIRDNDEMANDQKLRKTEEALKEIRQLRNRMPPEIRNKEEGKFLENMQGMIYQLTGQIKEQMDPRMQNRFENMEENMFPPLVRDDGEFIDASSQ